MSKARDISNLFSASTDVATDAEVNSAISNHATSTTYRHYKSGTHSSRPGSPIDGDLYFNTSKKAFETWNGSEWISVAVNGAIPLSPTIGTATVSGITASVPFSGPEDFGDAAITSYTATSTPGSITGSGGSSPISVSGLSANTSYTFTVTATNSYGTSLASSASNSITTADVPGVPTSVTATDPGTDGYAEVSWTAPASNGGSAITDYTVQYSSNSGSSWSTFSDGTSTNTTATVTGLTLNTAYIFRVAAVNAIGTGSYSDPSASFTPVVHDNGGLMPLQVITVGAAGASSITFSNIPNTYEHLQIRAISKSDQTGTSGEWEGLALRFNADSNGNYARHFLRGNGVSATAGAASSQTFMTIGVEPDTGYSSVSSMFSGHIIDISDYANTNKYKTVKGLGGFDSNNTGTNNGIIEFSSGLWQSTSAITSITFTSGGSFNRGFTQHSKFALYGVKGAS